MTLDIYAGLFADDLDTVADQLDEPLGWANTRLITGAESWREGSNCWSTCRPCSTVRRVPRERRAERGHRSRCTRRGDISETRSGGL